MQYNQCTTEELCGFVMQRRKEKRLRTNISRQEAIRILKRLDKKPRFERFLELPAEMRNEVYSYLVGERQILQTSKQVRKEAAGLVR